MNAAITEGGAGSDIGATLGLDGRLDQRNWKWEAPTVSSQDPQEQDQINGNRTFLEVSRLRKLTLNQRYRRCLPGL